MSAFSNKTSKLTISAELPRLGFEPVGTFGASAFAISPQWRGKQVVYIWTEDGVRSAVLRVGIACGVGGFGRRYDHYNRWLAGNFKPDDAREQKVRSLFLSRLNADCRVWARAVEDKTQALQEETELRSRWGDVLDLDLMVRGGWAKVEMRAWRESRLGVKEETPSRTHTSASSFKQSSQRSADHGGLGCEALRYSIGAKLESMGLSPKPVGCGTSYKLGNATLCRIDPKVDFLRVQVGPAAERAAPSCLRGPYKQEGWLIIRPQHAAIGEAYVADVVQRRMSERT